MIEALTTSIVTSPDAVIEVDTELPDVVVDVSKSITAMVYPDTYVLVSDGMFSGNATGGIPNWLLDAIQQELTVGEGNLMSVLDAMQSMLDSVQLGVNQTITQVENLALSQSALSTTLGSRIDDNAAAIIDVLATRVTATEASALAATAIGATFGGNVDAYIGNLASVYTSAGSATATNISTLQTSYNEQTVRIDTVESVNITQATQITAIDSSVAELATVLIPSLQAQIDGVINTWFYNEAPTLLNAPVSTWLDDTTKMNHVGDLYYDKVTGYGYRFAYEDIADTPDMGIIFSWIQITDVDVVNALVAAVAAQATADGKAAVYYKTSTEIDTITSAWTAQQKLDNVGDVWVDSATGVSKIWNTAAWINVATVDANTALSKLADLEEARDGVIDIFYVTTAPLSGMSYGDYWVDTDSWDGTKYIVSRYEALDGSSIGTLAWRTNTGETAVTLGKAYRADVLAGTAQSTADGKVKTWYQTTAPVLTASDVGDIWVDTDAGNLTKTWSGTAWVDIINTQSNTAYTWSANASKLITSPDGSVTGWSFGDGSNIKSYFQIQATNFKISDGTTGYTPFSIVGSDILFNGKVSFTNVTDAPPINSTFVQISAPTSGMIAGDTWLDSDGGYAVYTYSGTAWVAGGAKTYSQISAPTSGMITGDIWVDTDAGNKIYRYSGTAWVDQTLTSGAMVSAINGTTNTTTIDGGKITTGSITAGQIAAGSITADKLAVMGLSTFTNDVGYTDDTLATMAYELAETKATTYYQAAAPTVGLVVGDLWFDTDDNNRQYRWSGTAWVEITLDVSGLGLSGNKTFYQTTAPTASAIGDLWFDTDDNYKTYRWSGSAWQASTQDAAVAINKNTTTILGSKITTGTVTASQIAANTITASNIATGTITADRMNVTTLSAISANMGTITAGSITAALITAGTISVQRLPGLSVQNLNQRTTDISLAANNTVSSFSAGFTVPTTPTTNWVTVATFSHVKSTAKVKLSAQLSLNGQTAGDYSGTGYLWGRITRNGTVVIMFLLGPAYRFSMIQQTNGGQRTSFEAVDTYATAGTYTYNLDLVISNRLTSDTNWHCKDAMLSSLEVII